MMIITSKNNPLVKETATLKEKKGRKQLGSFLVEGKKMAEECLSCGMDVERVFLCEGIQLSVPVPEDKIVTVSEDVMRHLSDEKTPQGVLCRVRIPARELLPPTGNCLFLDGVADPGNMGAIIRTANAAGYTELYLTKECTDPFSPKSVRASMSGVFFTKLYLAERSEIISMLKNAGVQLVVADMGGENLFSFTPSGRFALVIGNEGNGISDEVRERADCTVRIPMQSTQESLNAAVAAGISMYLLAKEQFTN
jgi:TrmH family RNA methyltransferase